MKKHTMLKRFRAIFLSLTMILGMIPAKVFADNDFEMEPLGVPIATRDAAEPEESSVGNHAKNAIHAFVGIQVGGDLNLPLSTATDQQFKPIAGVKAYFQWFENGGYASPVYYAVSDANGRLNIGCKPYVAADGKIIKFDADTTVSGGNEKYRFWIDENELPDSIKNSHQLQYITGENVVFPSDNAWISQGGATIDVVPNTISDMKILFMEKPKAFMHKDSATVSSDTVNGGYIWGKVTWDYESPSGGVQWGIVATPSSPAPGVQIKASYLSDYAMKQIYSPQTAIMMSLSSPDDIRGNGWTYALERQLQDWIQEQVKKDPENWIAETVTTKSSETDANGDYKIQFNGTWGPARNKDAANYSPPSAWSQNLKDRIGTVADNATDGSFALAALPRNAKHINIDWMFISAVGTEDLRVMTPFNNNWFTGISGLTGNWGFHNGWAQTAFGVTTAQAANTIRADFGLGSSKINFYITNYDSGINTAIPGDVAQTKTTGLPYQYTTDRFQIVWYDPDGKEVGRGKAQTPSGIGTIDSAPLDTSKLTITKTTEYTAKLYRVKPDGSLEAQPIAADSFTVEVNHLFVSLYDDVKIENPKAKDPEMAGASYSATGLPEDIKIDATNGDITGKATKTPGVYTSNFKTVLPDKSGNIEGTRKRYITITDSPLAKGEVGVAYSQKVIPIPKKDQKENDYVYKLKSVKFKSYKNNQEISIDGLSITGDTTNGFTISGTPTEVANATEDILNDDPGPNVEVTYDIYRTNDLGNQVLVAENHVDHVPLLIEPERLRSDPIQKYDEDTDKQYIEGTLPEGKTLPDGSTVELVKKVGDDYVKVDVPVSTDNNKLTVDVKNNNIVDGEVYYFAITEPGRNPAYSNNPVKIDKNAPTFGESGVSLAQDIYTYKVKIAAKASDDSGILRLYALEDKDSGYYDKDSKLASASLPETIKDQLAKEKEYKVTAVDKFGNKNIVTQNLQPKTKSLVINADRPISGKNYIFVKADPGTKLKIEVINSDKSKALTMTYTQQAQRDKIQLNSLTLAKGQKVKISASNGTNKTTLTVRVR